jgi:two-component system chemotaxis response regulator CheB
MSTERTEGADAVVLGGSAGALDAPGKILPSLPGDYPLPVALVLHLPASGPSYLADVLRATGALPVKEAEDKEPILPAALYLAPPNYHLLVEKTGRFSLSVDDPVLFSRPSIDVLFESAAEVFGPRTVAVLLSGANEDGARGLRRVHELGGRTVVQAPRTAFARAMPEAALRLTPGAIVLSLSELGPFLACLHPRGA